MEFAKLVVQGLGIAFAAALGYFELYYKDFYLPRSLTPHLTVTNEVEVLGVRNGLRAVQVELNFANESETTVEVLAAGYTVTANANNASGARNINFEAIRKDDDGNYIVPSYGDTHAPFYNQTSNTRLIQVGSLLGSRWVFNPKEDAQRDFVILVPEDFDMIRLSLSIVFAKDDTGLDGKFIINAEDRKSGVELFVEHDVDGQSLTERFDPTNETHLRITAKRGVGFTDAVNEYALWPQAKEDHDGISLPP